jgi:hypothetical protein
MDVRELAREKWRTFGDDKLLKVKLSLSLTN